MINDIKRAALKFVVQIIHALLFLPGVLGSLLSIRCAHFIYKSMVLDPADRLSTGLKKQLASQKVMLAESEKNLKRYGEAPPPSFFLSYLIGHTLTDMSLGPLQDVIKKRDSLRISLFLIGHILLASQNLLLLPFTLLSLHPNLLYYRRWDAVKELAQTIFKVVAWIPFVIAYYYSPSLRDKIDYTIDYEINVGHVNALASIEKRFLPLLDFDPLPSVLPSTRDP